MDQEGTVNTHEEGPLSKQTLSELRLYSTFIFVLAALLVQFLLTLHTAYLLKAHSYPIQYSLFSINYLSESRANWTVDKVFFVFVSGPIIITTFGLFLLFLLKQIAFSSWKTRLTLTWMAFLMVNAIPLGLIAGLLSFDGLGIAFQWSVDSFIARGVIALAVLLILIIFSRFWWLMFLKTSFTAAFLQYGEHQKIFLKNIYFKPWIYGLIILMLFNWRFNSFFWPLFLLSLGYCAIPFFNRMQMFPNLRIMRSEKKIFASRVQIFYYILVITLAWIAGIFTIHF